eukprot:SAG31_NODE_5708_length_2369_cov_2.891630_2_plen_153_part_00
MPQYNMQTKLEEFLEQGFVVFENLFDPDVLDSIMREYMKLYRHVVQREAPTTGRYEIKAGDTPGTSVPVRTVSGQEKLLYIPFGCEPGTEIEVIEDTRHKGDTPASAISPTGKDLLTGHGRMLESQRYNINLPFKLPFADPHIYENPTIMVI